MATSQSGYKMNKMLACSDRQRQRLGRRARISAVQWQAAKIVTERVTAIINIPIMKDHGTAGISNEEPYGTFDNPGRHHGTTATRILPI